MDYQYDVVNYDKNIPATIMYLNLSSSTHKTELQWHREPEIVYVIEGRSECSRNGESQIVEQGDFIMFNSEDVHLVRSAEGAGCRLLCINFSFEYIRMFCKSIDTLYFDVTSSSEVRPAIVELLKKISDVDTTSDYASLIQIAYINKLYVWRRLDKLSELLGRQFYICLLPAAGSTQTDKGANYAKKTIHNTMELVLQN